MRYFVVLDNGSEYNETVHREDCDVAPEINRKPLADRMSLRAAVREARGLHYSNTYEEIRACKHCAIREL